MGWGAMKRTHRPTNKPKAKAMPLPSLDEFMDRITANPQLRDDFVDEQPADVELVREVAPTAVVPAGGASSVPSVDNTSSLLLASLIELFCAAFSTDDARVQRRLFHACSQALVDRGVLPSVVLTDEFYATRERYRWAFQKLLQDALAVCRLADDDDGGPHASVRRAAADFFASRPVSTALELPAQLPAIRDLLVNRYNSRYGTEFVELGCLGKGGFGQVFKVRSHMDACLYAVKKISFDFSDAHVCFRVLREVKVLASLKHRNVVRYYGAWLEIDGPAAAVGLRTRRPSRSQRGARIQELQEESDTGSGVSASLRKSVSSPSISFRSDCVGDSASTATTSLADDDDDGNSADAKVVSSRFWTRGGDTSASESSVSHHRDGRLATWRSLHRLPTSAFPSVTHFVVFLQMELCTRTLRDYLNERNAAKADDAMSLVNEPVNARIVRQLLKAIAYIHSQNLIHRDVKPSNVFLRDADDGVLLGDFGLACDAALGAESTAATHEGGGDGDVTAATRAEAHSSGLGTLSYSAPEQLSSWHYDSAVDVFSFGVIVYEMYFPFRTYMERMHQLLAARNGSLDVKFRQRWPRQAEIIERCLDPVPSKRPAARQLLDSHFIGSKGARINDLQVKVAELQAEVRRLSAKD